MSVWEIGTWLAFIILAPGALLVFCLFLRDIRKILQQLEEDHAKKQ
jgi:hypothetical protein